MAIPNLFDRMSKVIQDDLRVAEFKLQVCDNDCKVHIRATWGPQVDAHQPRRDWRLALTKALDEFDQIKGKHDTAEATTDKE